ncbi:MAG TPA: hypothetical protein PK264_05260 [Hyphomicrobiaceae bacterium]|nr:hypothetical protein [Hyphomicrobiaceae bacterium]
MQTLLPFMTHTTPARLPSGAGARHRAQPGRAPHEFYPTPPAAIRALLAAERFDGSIWEPACGDGAISKELIAHGYDVTSTDLVDHGYGRHGVDFLATVFPRGRNIVTNPPYGSGLADRFLRHALSLTRITGGRVAMLLNITSLCSPTRHDSFIRRPPSVLYALDDCVCWPSGKPALATRHTLNHRYVWAVWEPETVPVTTTAFRWLATAPFTDDAIRTARRSTRYTSTRTKETA